jgi:hypothetical protein
MSKSTERILVKKIFKAEKEEWLLVGYESWDGVWRNLPYVCLVKERNLGRRDGQVPIHMHSG